MSKRDFTPKWRVLGNESGFHESVKVPFNCNIQSIFEKEHGMKYYSQYKYCIKSRIFEKVIRKSDFTQMESF